LRVGRARLARVRLADLAVLAVLVRRALGLADARVRTAARAILWAVGVGAALGALVVDADRAGLAVLVAVTHRRLRLLVAAARAERRQHTDEQRTRGGRDSSC